MKCCIITVFSGKECDSQGCGGLKWYRPAMWRYFLVGDEYVQTLLVDYENVTVNIPFSFPAGNQVADVMTFESGEVKEQMTFKC